MKYIIILGDGMADWAVPSLGNKTLLQYANTPYMDKLAQMGRTGMLKQLPTVFIPEVKLRTCRLWLRPTVSYEGRGVLEAASIGVDLEPGDMAMRCNLICVEGDILKNHSAGHITTEEADQLIKFLDEKLGTDRIRFYTGVQYRHLLVIKGGDKRLACVPPHDVPLKPFRPNLVKALCPEAQETADLLNALILKSQELLATHPVNQKRLAEGKDAANSIWPWSPGYRPQMEPLSQKYPSIHKGGGHYSCRFDSWYRTLCGAALYRCRGSYRTLQYELRRQGSGSYRSVKTDDFVYLHIEASDEAGHEGDIDLKLKTIEYLDSRAVGPIYEEVKTGMSR